MKIYCLFFCCDGYDFSCETILKAYQEKEAAVKSKHYLEAMFEYYSKAIESSIKNKNEIFKDFLDKAEWFAQFFKKEHLLLKEEYSFEVKEIEFEGG